jgi:hypothetical protein
LDEEVADERALGLRGEIVDFGAQVTQRRRLVPDPGAAAEQPKGDFMEWATLVVTFTGGLPGLLPLIKSWRRRNDGVDLALEIDDDLLSLSGLSPEEAHDALRRFEQRHGLGDEDVS